MITDVITEKPREIEKYNRRRESVQLDGHFNFMKITSCRNSKAYIDAIKFKIQIRIYFFNFSN